MSTDKLNRVDYHWFLIRTQPHQEKVLTDLLAKHRLTSKNILEVYCPLLSGANIRREGGIGPKVLFTGVVFVLSTLQAITDFLEQRFPKGVLLYDYSKKTKTQKASVLTIPEKEMQKFKDFNENYSDQMIILCRNRRLHNEIQARQEIGVPFGRLRQKRRHGRFNTQHLEFPCGKGA